MRLLWVSCILLAICDLSWAVDPNEVAPVESCTTEQAGALVLALNMPAIAPHNVEVSLELGECRQIKKDTMLAFAVFIPEVSYRDEENVSVEEMSDRSFRLMAGLFDTNERRVVSSYFKSFPSSGWIRLYESKARVLPQSYGHGKTVAFSISHGHDRAANAADFHASETLTLLMQDGAALKPVLRDIPIASVVALTQGGGICCAHVLLHTTRTLIPTRHVTLGLPDLILRAEREVEVDESRGALPEAFAHISRTYSYMLQFNGREYHATQSRKKDAWDALDSWSGPK